jgi:hypothetical protein
MRVCREGNRAGVLSPRSQAFEFLPFLVGAEVEVG